MDGRGCPQPFHIPTFSKSHLVGIQHRKPEKKFPTSHSCQTNTHKTATMKHILLSNRFLNKFARTRSRVPSTSSPGGSVKKTSESDGSSALSLGALQRRSIASSLNTSALTNISHSMQLKNEGKMNKRRNNSSLCCERSQSFNTTDDLTSSRSSSIDIMTLESQLQEQERNINYDTSASSSMCGEECNHHDSESIDDFVVPISLMKKKQTSQKTSKKKNKALNSFRIFMRKSLKLPLDKSHQRWSRYSFDSRMSSELKL